MDEDWDSIACVPTFDDGHRLDSFLPRPLESDYYKTTLAYHVSRSSVQQSASSVPRGPDPSGSIPLPALSLKTTPSGILLGPNPL